MKNCDVLLKNEEFVILSVIEDISNQFYNKMNDLWILKFKIDTYRVSIKSIL